MKPLCSALMLAGLLGVSPPGFAESTEELAARLDAMSAEIKELRAELARVKAQQAGVEAAQAAPVPAAASPAPPAVAATVAAPNNTSEPTKAVPVTTPRSIAAAPRPGAAPGVIVISTAAAADSGNEQQTTIFGYGELNYTRPRNNSAATQFDVRRAILGIGHRFDESTRFAMELEFEHAVTSKDDKGEVAVEQAFVDHAFKPGLGMQAGLFLLPVGFLNRRHEPTAYYGVERNFVETAIIPSTWREGGAALRGDTESGFTWSTGLTTGFDLSKWDAAGTGGRKSPLASIHQEGQLAHAKNLAGFGALEYIGVPGLLVGGFVFTQKAGQGQAGFTAASPGITLWDLHARWTPGKWDLSAVYAAGRISGTSELNLVTIGNPTPIPKAFFGWYLQGAYTVWTRGDRSLSPFVRYERFNTASQYAAFPPGLGIAAGQTERVVTAGASFRLNPNVVFKADYQKFDIDPSRDRFSLGLGYAF